MPPELDDPLRLAAATLLGMGLGLTRDLSGKPAGLRTMGLVSLGAAVITVSALHLFPETEPDAISRVMQGVIQGVLTGIGFIGAGAVLHDPGATQVRGLTTAATVWVASALGVACGVAAWPIVITGAAISFLVIVALHPFEKWVERQAAKDGLTDKSDSL